MARVELKKFPYIFLSINFFWSTSLHFLVSEKCLNVYCVFIPRCKRLSPKMKSQPNRHSADLTQSRRVTVATDTGYPNRNPRMTPSTHVCEMVCSNRGPSHPALSLRSNKFQQLSRISNVNHISNRNPLHPKQRPDVTPTTHNVTEFKLWG